MYYQLKTDVTSQIWSDGIYSFQERIGVTANDSLNIVKRGSFKMQSSQTEDTGSN
jgi:hypothetical protein